jgi:hypothetical protein
MSCLTGGRLWKDPIMLKILMSGTQVWEKASTVALPWRVVGQGRYGVICRRSEGGNVTTRCFSPDELVGGEAPRLACAHGDLAVHVKPLG